MKITYIGTAAAEALPAPFCRCPVCESARKNGGREARGRSGANINGGLQIDFPPDIYYGASRAGVLLPDITDLIVTHAHEDHFDAYELSTRRTPVTCVRREGEDWTLNVYGNMQTGMELSRYLPGAQTGEASGNGLGFKYLPLFEPATLSCGLTVTALPADHDKAQECRIYLIEEIEKNCTGTRRFLYGHDTGLFPEAAVEFLRGKRCGAVSLDCTNVMQKGERWHMGLPADIKMKKMLFEIGAADEKTVFVANHFSHNGFINEGKVYSLAEFESIAAGEGFIISYDGMKLEI